MLSISDKSSNLPVIAILANIPLGRLMPNEFQNQDHTLIPWIFAIFQDLLKQSQYSIHWITLKKYVSSHTVKILGNQTIHILPDPSLAIGLFTGHYLASRRIQNLLRTLQPDLIHVWGIEYPYAKACMNTTFPKLLSYQGSLIAYCQRSKMKWFPKMQAFWEKRTTPHYHHITCESPWARDRVLEISPSSQISLIEYGVEESFFHVERSPSPTPTCMFAGTICELKGVSYLIRAFTNPVLQHVQLYLAGSGALRKKLEPICTPNIHWLGSLQRPELQQYLASAWCLIHPTLADTGPTIVKEARCMSLPVITTTEAGSKQYVEDGKSGYIIPPKNSNAIQQAVLAITESLDKAIDMGKYGIKDIKNKLNIKTTSADIINAYKKILKC